jgi:hypothetical protein
MFVNSSNTIRSKILQAAMEIDEDYREYIQNRDRYNTPYALESKDIIRTIK